MKFCMAMVALEQGKKVRLSTWCKDDYIFLKNGLIFHQGNMPYDIPSTVPMHSSWELYTESVKLSTLKEGDSFMYNTRRYTVIPQYLKHHCGNMTADSIPVISDAKVFTSLFGNVVVRKV